MTTKPKGAGKALRLNLPGAPEEWHFIPGVPGLYHPIHITPFADVGLDAAAAKVLADDESVHLEFADATDDELKAASKELLKASTGALGGAKNAARVATAVDHEVDLIRASADAAGAVKTDKEN